MEYGFEVNFIQSLNMDRKATESGLLHHLFHLKGCTTKLGYLDVVSLCSHLADTHHLGFKHDWTNVLQVICPSAHCKN